MTELVSDYVTKFPDPEMYDETGQRVLKSFGKDFLIQSDPTFIYYSHYLTPARDEYLSAPPSIHVKPMNLKRAAKQMSKKKQPSKKRVKKGTNVQKSAI